MRTAAVWLTALAVVTTLAAAAPRYAGQEHGRTETDQLDGKAAALERSSTTETERSAGEEAAQERSQAAETEQSGGKAATLKRSSTTETEQSAGETSIVIEPLPGQLPVRWFAGDYGRQPTVKDQGKYGTCWAITATSALEAALLPEQRMVFSADHLSRSNAFTADVADGGDYLMTLAYLSGWQGPVTEEEDPYGDEYSPPGLRAAIHVQEVQILERPELAQIKEAVRRYGSVQTSLYLNRTTTAADSLYYNETMSAYCVPEVHEPNHETLILGWDDHISRFCFRQTPDQDGAFICQNTWGTEFGDDGIFYVSYADANIGGTCLVYSGIEPADNYRAVYQTDDCGWQGRQGYDSDSCWFANVYTAAETEQLAAVGFYATGANASYEIYLVPEFSGAESFAERVFLQSGALEHVGYYTVRLEQPQRLTQGQRFAVAVRMTTPGVNNPVAVEYQADEYTENVVTSGKEGYLSRYGDLWQNTEASFGTNVCLKVYTM